MRFQNILNKVFNRVLHCSIYDFLSGFCVMSISKKKIVQKREFVKHCVEFPNCNYMEYSIFTADRFTAEQLAQLVECRTTVREVAGSNPGRITTQSL